MFLEVEAKYQGTTATGRNGKTKDSEDTLTGAMPLLYNSIEGVREPLDRRKWSCAEPNALANLTKAVRIPTANYKQIEFGPAKTWKTSFSGAKASRCGTSRPVATFAAARTASSGWIPQPTTSTYAPCDGALAASDASTVLLPPSYGGRLSSFLTTRSARATSLEGVPVLRRHQHLPGHCPLPGAVGTSHAHRVGARTGAERRKSCEDA